MKKYLILSSIIILLFLALASYGYTSDIQSNAKNFYFTTSWLRMYKLGMVETPDAGWIQLNTMKMDRSIDHADFLLPPPFFEKNEVDLDSSDLTFLISVIEPYLDKEYYDEGIFEYTKSYCDTLRVKNREFYFDFYSNGVYMLLSGCYGKFAHIYVITDFDSKNSFIKKANEFFNLPDIEKSEVKYEEYVYPDKSTDYYYSYHDRDNKFSLAGFSTIQSGYKDKTVPTREVTVIDLKINAGEVEKK